MNKRDNKDNQMELYILISTRIDDDSLPADHKSVENKMVYDQA